MPLKLDIKNFGPITSGSFELKPLTIFIGPNNAGKSYAAMLTHGIFNFFNLIPSHIDLIGEWRKVSSGLRKTLVEQANEILTGNRAHFSQELTQNVLGELRKEKNSCARRRVYAIVSSFSSKTVNTPSRSWN